jgi:EpsD family peptidyl-prolyl cis-trans isomerase
MTTCRSSIKLLVLTILLSSFTLLSAGCGSGNGNKIATQVVAKVGADEITVDLLNGALSKKQPAASEDVDRLRWETLEGLIDQQVAFQQAVKQKLDQSPEVVLALELARRHVIAQAYRDQIVGVLPPPTDAEARKYYVEHPELFSGRRIFKLDETVITSPDVPVAKLRDMAAARRSPQEIGAFLTKQNARFVARTETLAAEQISMDVLQTLHTLKDGDVAVVESSQSVRMLRIVSSDRAPIDQRAALPGIRSFLSNQRATETLKRDISQLRGVAGIEYRGEFAATSAPSVVVGDKRP